MMFKITSIVALAAALMFNAEATAVDGSSKLEARQPLPCPSNGLACGWYLLGGTGGPVSYKCLGFPPLPQ